MNLRENARIPAKIEELAVDQELFYVNNTPVPEADGSRIIGPLTEEQLKWKRQQYEKIVKQIEREANDVREKYPFIVYSLKRVE